MPLKIDYRVLEFYKFVPCPACGAEVGQHCRHDEGDEETTAVHTDRAALADLAKIPVGRRFKQ